MNVFIGMINTLIEIVKEGIAGNYLSPGKTFSIRRAPQDRPLTGDHPIPIADDLTTEDDELELDKEESDEQDTENIK